MDARAHVLVSGKVQGVFFRANTKDLAKKLGLKGWVRNTEDGNVECIFEGEKEKIEEMIDFVRKGPPGARVEDVEIKWEEFRNEFEDFRIRYWD
jgi:acylphosphatase